MTHLPDVVDTTHVRNKAVKPEGDSAMRRAARPQGLEQMTKGSFDPLITEPQVPEHLMLELGLVDPD